MDSTMAYFFAQKSGGTVMNPVWASYSMQQNTGNEAGYYDAKRVSKRAEKRGDYGTAYAARWCGDFLWQSNTNTFSNDGHVWYTEHLRKKAEEQKKS